MDFDPHFSSIWNRSHEFEFIFDGATQVRYCKYGKDFALWAEGLIAQAKQAPTDVSIHVAKLHLLQRYWEWYVSVPPSHQNYIGNRSQHVCIFQVFKEAFFRLHAVALSLTPPRLVEPAPSAPLPPPVSIIGGIFLGEEDDDGQ